MTFDKRRDKFENIIEKAMEECNVELYAANVCMPNGEVLPVLKVTDKEVTKKEDGDNSKK